jgi:hypothetical protein
MRRGFAIPLVLVMLVVIGGFAYIVHLYRQNLDAVLERVLAGGDLETLALSALDEAHYQLALAHAPSSRSAARTRIARAQELGPRAPGWSGWAEPGDGGGLRLKKLDHDAPKFLRDGDTAYFAPVTVASTLVPDGQTALEPVTVKVLERAVGKDVKSPYAGELQPTAQLLAELGLPPGMDAVKITWGVLELRAEVQRKRLFVGVARTVVQRKLFMVIDYTPSLEPAKSYAHVFPAPLAQVVLRD